MFFLSTSHTKILCNTQLEERYLVNDRLPIVYVYHLSEKWLMASWSVRLFTMVVRLPWWSGYHGGPVTMVVRLPWWSGYRDVFTVCLPLIGTRVHLFPFTG